MNADGTAVKHGGKWQISNGGGLTPRWRGDGRELYYRARDRRVMAVAIATEPEFRPGKPEPLGFFASLGDMWDCTADGRRFLVVTAKGKDQAPFTVVLNWQAALKK